jgi:hypothetical protein
VTTLTGPGRRIAEQTCKIKDHRSGAADVPMRDSGYKLDRKVIMIGGVLHFLITKIGTATTANGIPSGAGVGHIAKNQVV